MPENVTTIKSNLNENTDFLKILIVFCAWKEFPTISTNKFYEWTIAFVIIDDCFDIIVKCFRLFGTIVDWDTFSSTVKCV